MISGHTQSLDTVWVRCRFSQLLHFSSLNKSWNLLRMEVVSGLPR
jgi:hypothetical protein